MGALGKVVEDIWSALHALERHGESGFTERLNNDVEEIRHLAKTYFPRLGAK